MGTSLPDLSLLTDAEIYELQFLAEQRDRLAQMSENDQRLQEERVKLQRSSADFFRVAWNVLEPGKPIEWSWHYDLIGEWLHAAFLKQVTRLIINVPYRSAKSNQVTISWPAWCWTMKPELCFLGASYSDQLSSDHSVKRRRLIESAWYQSLWPLEFSRDTNRQDQYRNVKTGEMIATSVGASATGRGGDILILDDAMNAADAMSLAKQKQLHDWFPNVFRSRLNDPATGVIIVIEQRTGEKDMTGWLLKNEPDQWTHIVVPTQCDEVKTYSFPISKREFVREVGDVLQPARHTPEVIATRKIHSRTWATQDQQRPAPDSGIVFKREWWRFRKVPRAQYNQIITSWDFAVEGNSKSDFNCGVCVGVFGAEIDLLDVFKERLPFTEQLKAFKSFSAKHPQARRHLIEKKANGPAIISTIKAEVAGVIAIEPTGSKLQRADAATPEVEAGNVYLMEDAPWVHDFIESLTVFPNGSNDDDVDAFDQAVNWLRAHRHHFGLIQYYEAQEAAEAAEAEAYMQTSTMSKPDRGHQDVACPKCGIESVVRIGNTLRCNSCSNQWPAVKTVEFDPKIMGRTATMAK
jgi:predicted phage terminase large subunit-like protein